MCLFSCLQLNTKDTLMLCFGLMHCKIVIEQVFVFSVGRTHGNIADNLIKALAAICQMIIINRLEEEKC